MWAIVVMYACLGLNCPEERVDARRFVSQQECNLMRTKLEFGPGVLKTECRYLLAE